MMANYDLLNYYSVSDSISLNCTNNNVSNFVVSSELSVNGVNNRIVLTDEKPMNFKECNKLIIDGTNNNVINVYFNGIVSISVNGTGNTIKGKASQFYRVQDWGMNNDISITKVDVFDDEDSNNSSSDDIVLLCRAITLDFERYLFKTTAFEERGVDYDALKKVKKKYKNIIDKKKYISNRYCLLGYIIEKRTNKCNRGIVSSFLDELFKSIGFNDIGDISTALYVYNRFDFDTKAKFLYALCGTFYVALVRK